MAFFSNNWYINKCRVLPAIFAVWPFSNSGNLFCSLWICWSIFSFPDACFQRLHYLFLIRSFGLLLFAGIDRHYCNSVIGRKSEVHFNIVLQSVVYTMIRNERNVICSSGSLSPFRSKLSLEFKPVNQSFSFSHALASYFFRNSQLWIF